MAIAAQFIRRLLIVNFVMVGKKNQMSIIVRSKIARGANGEDFKFLESWISNRKHIRIDDCESNKIKSQRENRPEVTALVELKNALEVLQMNYHVLKWLPFCCYRCGFCKLFDLVHWFREYYSVCCSENTVLQLLIHFRLCGFGQIIIDTVDCLANIYLNLSWINWVCIPCFAFSQALK